jgi:tetratricopeptide (TPR) repeat protein
MPPTPAVKGANEKPKAKPVEAPPVEPPAKIDQREKWLNIPQWAWVGIVVPLVVGALVPVVIHFLGRSKTPDNTTAIHNTYFSGDMYFKNEISIANQYQQTAGQPLNDATLKQKIEQAAKLVANNNFKDAAPILQEVAQQVPVGAVYNNLGVAYANSNDLPHAEEAFRQAVEKDPDDQASWANLGLVQLKQGKRADAMASFDKAPDLAPKQITGLVGIDILHPQPLELGTTVQAAVVSDTESYFAVNTPPKYRDWIEVSTTNQSTTLKPALAVFGPDKSNISGDQYNFTPGGNLTYSFVGLPSAKYYVKIWGFDSSGGNYAFLVRPTKSYDRYEPNDDIQHASPISLATIEANIMDGGDEDYYEFTAPSRAGNIDVVLANRSTTLKPTLRVFNADRTNISGDQTNYTEGGNVRYTFAAQPNASYYVGVLPYSGTAGAYSLTLTPH